jgi:hypothetical protein
MLEGEGQVCLIMEISTKMVRDLEKAVLMNILSQAWATSGPRATFVTF